MNEARSRDYKVSKGDFIMGTFINLKASGNSAQKAVDESIARLKYLESIMSAYRVESDVYKINNNSGVKFTKIRQETLFVIRKAIEYSKISKGGFDVTVKPIVDMWKRAKENQRLPEVEDIKRKLELVNYNDIKIFFNKIKLRNKDQKIDLGGIAKGYAADEIVRIMRKYEINSAIIDLGGNIVVIGKKENNESWKIGIQNPYKKRGEIVGYIVAKNKSIVTSGDYERFITINEQKYHHFLDSKTGYPLNNGIKSVTIVSDKSIDGDGLTSCCFSMGLEKTISLINSIDGVEGIIIAKNKKIYLTEGLANEFKVLDKDFEVQMNV